MPSFWPDSFSSSHLTLYLSMKSRPTSGTLRLPTKVLNSNSVLSTVIVFWTGPRAMKLDSLSAQPNLCSPTWSLSTGNFSSGRCDVFEPVSTRSSTSLPSISASNVHLSAEPSWSLANVGATMFAATASTGLLPFGQRLAVCPNCPQLKHSIDRFFGHTLIQCPSCLQ